MKQRFKITIGDWQSALVGVAVAALLVFVVHRSPQFVKSIFGLLLWVCAIWSVADAFRELWHKPKTKGDSFGYLFWLAGIGFLVLLALILVLFLVAMFTGG